MNSLLLSSSALLLSACTINLHIHEAPRPPAAPETAAMVTPAPAPSPSHTSAAATQGSVSGVVVDAQGQPMRAHVAAVGVSGSVAAGTDEQGRFALDHIQWSDIVLNASTQDGRVAVQATHTGSNGVELVLQPGATLVIDVEGREKTRCAIFQNEQRIEDFTLRTGKPAHVVVPPGEVRVRLYDGEHIYKEEMLTAAVGSTEAVNFKLGS
jgi:hypothetical protein